MAVFAIVEPLRAEKTLPDAMVSSDKRPGSRPIHLSPSLLPDG